MVERAIEVDADVQAVWDTLTDVDGLDGWLGDRVDLDLRPGGCGRVVDDEGVAREVLVTAVEPGHRLAWHWWSDEGELSTVDITVAPVPGGSRVSVVETLTGEASGLGGGFRAEACAAAGRFGGGWRRRDLITAARRADRIGPAGRVPLTVMARTGVSR
jgi:uncharacterized protein YndB with AHSA1/START domain